ncbi:MAG TPA: class I SAM-dependent methyltransferase [Thermoanaerobaculia bacterium]|jgi:hypothetical protein|nr:class I SAM-dependent methyltransferase [Thermoanaerobaculia bacterium]
MDPGSFRDRQSRVLDVGGRIYRVFSPHGWEEWKALAASGFFARAVAAGQLVATAEAVPPPGSETVLPTGIAGAVAHQRVPFVSYPYEWTFGMLREAALLQLDLLLAALDEGFTAKDASSYNVQWQGVRPTFIDIGSFERWTRGEPWIGYLQFCQLFLYPLLLTAYRGLRFQPWLRGALEGITADECRRLLRRRDLLRPGVLADVWLQARLIERAAGNGRPLRAELRDAGFSHAMVRRNVERLRRVVAGLRWRGAASAWSRYADDCHYSEADRAAKRAFVHAAAARRPRRLIWDLGTNTGEYARLVAPLADCVVAMDRDHAAVELLFTRLRESGPANVLPLVIDLLDPSPGLGWRQGERRPLGERGRPDLTLALALVHHLVLTGNVPLAELVDWFADAGGDLVVELVTKDDPMAARLLANKPDHYVDYTAARFEELLAARFGIIEKLPLASGTRLLYALEARR